MWKALLLTSALLSGTPAAAQTVTPEIPSDAGSLLQLRTFPLPTRTVISLIATIKPDLSAITTRAFVTQEGFKVTSVTVYLNNVVVANCPGDVCVVDVPTAKMTAGANLILVAYFNSNHEGRGTAFEIGKPTP